MQQPTPSAIVPIDAMIRDALRRNTALRGKVARACDVPGEGAEAPLREALRFLSLVADAEGQVLTPSPRVDEAWHQLILFTRTYQAFCEQHFGRMLHHAPGGDSRTNASQYHDTLRRYRDRFGEPDPAYWACCSVATPAKCGGCDAA